MLDRGVWIGGGPGADPLVAPDDDHHDHERAVVAQWLGAHAGAVRIVEVGVAHRDWPCRPDGSPS